VSLPKWVSVVVRKRGELFVCAAIRIRQRNASRRDATDTMFGVADKWQKIGREFIRIARQGTQSDIEHAYHEIVHGAGSVIAIPLPPV
jgi:hypothetical protein